MARFARDVREEQIDRRAAVLSGLRVIVCDTETTGLNPATSRIVSVALSEITTGRVMGGYATLVDPGLAHIGASHIHRITAETLRHAHAPVFDLVAPRIIEALTARDDTPVVLAGFSTTFDALLLHNELARIGQALPPVKLLDVRDLAGQASVPAASLADLAEALGIDAHDAHSSVGDTSVTAEALLRLVDRLRETDPDARIDAHLRDFDPRMRLSRRGTGKRHADPPPLTPEHANAHGQDLTHKARRESSLGVCIDQDCVELIARTQDGITDPARAWQVAEWIHAQLTRTDLTRATRGRLLTALARAADATENPGYIRECFDWLAPHLAGWGVTCPPGDPCDRCAADPARTCRYTLVRYQLVAAYLHEDNALSADRAREFLPHIPGDRRPGRGHPPTGWFGALERAGDLDTAGYGGAVAAQAGAQSRTRGHERRILAFAWDTKGSRNAHLADRYSLRILADGSTDPTRPHLAQAEAVCVAALAAQGTTSGSVYDRISKRLDRIRIRQANPPKPPPTHTRNKRPPRANPYAVG